MKLSSLIFTAGALAPLVSARGKGKGMVMSDGSCECVAATTRTLLTTSDGTPISNLDLAIEATPESCILKVPTTDDIQIYQVGAPSPIVPVFKDTAKVNTCTADSGDPTLDPPGCTLDWFFVDGTPVPSDIGGTDPTWLNAGPGEPLVAVDPTSGLFVTFLPSAANEFTAYYSCCYVSEDACAAFVEPMTQAPTPAKGKGGKGSRFL